MRGPQACGGARAGSGTRRPPWRRNLSRDASPRFPSHSPRRNLWATSRARPSSSAINLCESHRVEVLFRFPKEFLLGLAEVRRGDLRLDEAKDLRGSGDFLRLDRFMDQFGGNARLQFRQARILRGDLEHLIDELKRLVETACPRERLYRAFEHREAMNRSGIERHGDPAKFVQALCFATV